MKNTFLPVNKKDMFALGWDRPDIVYITGDAYVDHPSFGASIITRVLQAKGFKVAVLSQPDWKSTADFEQFGKPRLAYFITSGNILWLRPIRSQSVRARRMHTRQAAQWENAPTAPL